MIPLMEIINATNIEKLIALISGITSIFIESNTYKRES